MSIYLILLFCTSLGLCACPEVSGSFFIEQQDLYPESADWDPVTCRLYLSSQFNCTLVIYNPYNKTSKVVEIPGISHPGNPNYTEYHVNGIDYDAKSGNVFISVSSAAAFTSVIAEGADGTIVPNYAAANYTGPNRVVVFDPKTECVVTDVGLLSAQNEFHNATGDYTSAFQDIAEIESTGDAYAPATFGNTIVRIPSGSSEPELWYATISSSIFYGFGGIFSIGNKLVLSDSISGGLVTFDTTEQKDPKATYVPLQSLPSDYKPLNADGLFAPSKYGGKVALWSDDYNGTSVYGSSDNWETAHFLGLILNDDPGVILGAMTTASFEIGQRVFTLTQIFQYSPPVQSKKNFLFYDVTTQLDAIVKASFVGNLTQN
ncbi:hypothetical protein LTR10_023455 [Elasticomyces elasticus]|uniref:Uncharacterized protein n=1 Tax=Exophiala sideris TaxID=1016849 RepID=A0ABR0JAA1_9EURO|nr:hypothetical protein LTR10_023455 [Elasticomyces elasticus]KAK5022732.1 hypothetical protein LTS07_009709 [Exophiala sideris]KAK5023132.1 hypothetical protein LTR13_011309 [Exophiala sideris]KAK5059360.1 hypothetical protein LTR69_005948 [Exophiala sideris]KAK5176117.1 hypothetical protein LTR44_011331 [Eurotiomycetes sp. CCFEE 6388]